MSDLARDLAREFRKLQATEGNEPIRCSRMHFGDWAEEVEALDKQLFDMGGLNDAWALEVDQLKAQLAAAEAERDEAREAARWMMIKRPTPNTPDMMGVYERWPWLGEMA